MDKKPEKKDNTYCCVPQCSSRGSKNPDLSFHLFPNEKSKISVLSANGTKTLVSRRAEWIRVLRIGKKVSSRMTVCSKHFTQDDYSVTTGISQRARLKPYAVPSCCLPVLSVDKTRHGVQNTKVVERKQRYNEINRKRDANMPSTSASDDRLPFSYVDLEAEKLAVKALLDLSANDNDAIHDEEVCVELLNATASSSPKYVDKATQVVSGDLELPYIIVAARLTDRQLKCLTGLPNLLFLNELADCLNLEISMNNKHILPLKERIILVFMKIKLNLSFSCLGIFFGCSVSNASKIFSALVPPLALLFGELIEFPSKEDIVANLPKCCQYFPDTRIVLDCTEIYVQKKKCLNERILTYSQYQGKHTIKYLIGIAPSGLVTYVSKGYGGRASDRHIFEETNLLEMLEPHLDAIMTDKGFYIEDLCEKYFIKLIRPPYLKQKSQFSQSEAILCKKIARARVHVERSIGRIKTFMMLQSVIPYHLFNLMDQIMIIVAGITNASPPVLGDDKF